MSTNIQLTWDNLDLFIATLPKGDDGHFLPNPRANEKLVISVERDGWTDPSALLELSKDAVVQIPEQWQPTELTEPTILERVLDVLVDDDFIRDRELWEGAGLVSTVKGPAVYSCPTGDIFISKEPTGHPKESLLKIGRDKFYVAVVFNNFFPDFKGGPISKEMFEAKTELDAMICVQNSIISFLTKNVKEVAEKKARSFEVEALGKLEYLIVVTFHDDEALEINLTLPFCNDSIKKIVQHHKLPAIVENEVKPKENPILEKAKANLAKLDTTEAEKEFASSADNMKRATEIRKSGLLEVVDSPMNRPDMTPEQLKEWRLKNAKNIVGKMDSEFVAKGRLNVNDKTLMNSKTDLNQLIPFKYPWSWSIYLTSCERHWMPGETTLYRCKEEWKALDDNFKLLLARTHLTHLSRKQLFPESVLLNMYRMLENPECRQYLLRQSMEAVTIYHAWTEIDELLGVKHTLIGGERAHKLLDKDNDAFKARGNITLENIKFMHNFTSTTDAPEDLAAFVKAFIIMYTHTNFLMPMISHYQMITALEFNETCQPLAQMFQLMNRDSISQFNFAKLFVAGVLEENTGVFNQEWFEGIVGALEALMHTELNLVSTLKTGETEYNDVEFICKYFIDDMLSVVSPNYIKSTMPKDCDRGREFVQIIEGMAPKVDLSAGLGGVQW